MTETGKGRKSPATQDTKWSSNTSRREEMESNQKPAAPPVTQQGIVEGDRVKVNTQRHPDGADAARPKNSALARREYGLLAP